MRRVLNILLVATCLLPAQGQAQEVECYLLPGELRRLTFSFFPPAEYTLTGETSIGYFDPSYLLTGSAMTPTGQLLALDPGTPSLVAVDTETAHLTTVVNLNFGTWLLDDIAAVATGEIYVSSQASLYSQTSLYRVNLSTGDLTLVGDTGYTLESLGSLNGQLYATGYSAAAPWGAFMRLDNLTAQPSVITVFPPAAVGDARVKSLSSSWRELWGVFQIENPFGEPRFVGIVDPTTGNPVKTLWEPPPLNGVGNVEVRWSAPQKQTIPMLSRPMLALLVLMLAAAGVVAIRKLVG